ncbi:MAG: helix-hairpin-helix domain-containing protein [Methanocellales archaeon]|nr:helix-hairpin-helix domain-containing protein [Methanocellales archaeon]
MAKMRLLIDHREGNRIIEVAKRICEVEIVQLPLGDFLIVGGDSAVIIERKTSADFVSSVRSNRLWEQLLRFMKTDEIWGYEIKRRILVIHGDFEDHLDLIPPMYPKRALQAFWSSMMGAQLETLFVYDTPIVVVENDEAFYAFLKTIIKREEEGKNVKMPEARWYRKRGGLPVKDGRRFLLGAIPLIGESLAGNLLDHFDSIADIANASLEELQEVQGIGKKKAAKIYEIFH